MAMPVLIKSDIFEAKTKLSIHFSFFCQLIVWPTSKIFALFLRHIVMFSKDISINKPQLLNVEIQIIRFPVSKWFLSCVFRFPDCDEPYPRLVDLNLAGDPTEGASVAVQRDYGFWCPQELKIDPDLGCSVLHMHDCSPTCPNMCFRRGELSFARYFIGLISVICLSARLFTFLNFLIDVIRFRYPERPIIMYAICYMMVSLIFFIGFLLEDRVTCSASSPAQCKASTVTQGSHNKACIMLFMRLYFFHYG